MIYRTCRDFGLLPEQFRALDRGEQVRLLAFARAEAKLAEIERKLGRGRDHR